MADKYHSDTREKIESISYLPFFPNTGDLETGTHTIVPTSRPDIGSAQYSASLALPQPGDARLVVKRVCARLNVNIAGLGTATHVYCSVRVDVDDADHEIFNQDWTSTGSKLDAIDIHSGAKSTVFDLLKDGQSHTFYFLFWADAASQATIDIVKFWEGVGSCSTDSFGEVVIELDHAGLASMATYIHQEGTGNVNGRVTWKNDYIALIKLLQVGLTSVESTVIKDIGLRIAGTVNTDLIGVHRFYAVLRSE